MRAGFALGFMIACAAATASAQVVYEDGWEQPQRVTVTGYPATEDVMESFITRDGRHLLFNNRNSPPTDTNLRWAERVDDLTFTYRGDIAGANSTALDGVPTMDASGKLYFVSPRSYPTTLSTICSADWNAGTASNVALVSGISKLQPGWVQFDVEVNPAGDTLYAVDSQFMNNVPVSADLFIATKSSGVFQRAANSAVILQNVNTPENLEYAAAISSDGLALYFNRVAVPLTPDSDAAIWVARRASVAGPFNPPRRIRAITGFVEGATVAPDNRAIYYHKLEGSSYVLYRVAKSVPLTRFDRTGPGTYLLTVNAYTGCTFTLETSVDLSTWQPLTTVTMPGDMLQVPLAPPATVTKLFFHLRLLP